MCLTASSSAMCFLAYGSITPISDCLHMTILFMCVSTSSSLCVCPSSPFLISHIGLGPTHSTSSYLNYLFKTLSSHILRHGGLGVQHRNMGRTQLGLQQMHRSRKEERKGTVGLCFVILSTPVSCSVLSDSLRPHGL